MAWWQENKPISSALLMLFTLMPPLILPSHPCFLTTGNKWYVGWVEIVLLLQRCCQHQGLRQLSGGWRLPGPPTHFLVTQESHRPRVDCLQAPGISPGGGRQGPHPAPASASLASLGTLEDRFNKHCALNTQQPAHVTLTGCGR